MRLRNLERLGVSAVFALSLASLPVAPAVAATSLSANLSAGQEVPPAHSHGFGTFHATVDLHHHQLCYELQAHLLTSAPVAAHIHRGVQGVNGPIVVPLATPGSNWTSSGCISVEPALLNEIVNSPASFYTNLHTVQFPGGEIRGQLK